MLRALWDQKKIVEVYAHKIKWKPTKQYPAKPNSKKIL